jgi:hypothetical protein
MNYTKSFLPQYYAALEMLRLAVTKCPDILWDDPNDKNKFWHIAFHTLFYTHLYLQVSESQFVPWAKQRKDYQFLGRLPWPPHEQVVIGEPYTKEEVLEYLELCRAQAREMLALTDWEAETSGFSWLPFGKLDLQLYNLRHIQHHTGELMERLGTRAGIDVDWVWKKDD